MNIQQLSASPSNFTHGRGGRKVERVVIHVQDGTQQGSIAWFQNPASSVSAHYLVSMAGEIVQMVQEADTAWQAGDFTVNQTTIGIEHEGQPAKGPWTPTAAQLKASAELVADICKRYGITPNSSTIVPHSSINPKHNCPGPTWPWRDYLAQVAGFMAPAQPAHAPDTGKLAVRLFDPATNQQIGTGSLIVGSDKVYVVPNKPPV
ncbi:N-acetylmuramoyl-L-alanine amidase [Deinococcus ruber]|uniref:N-acetylmuramoyl-L-alanine amidase n=1 Tax=Deinococcus ruber TaxID=1848197 RepID=A0A918F4F4_9DEIO|nr:peptidoglycan recognition family protein [Deinococcus ruber]GGR00401.1 hypothetical protein GCM10008957_11500 [Deinococcus ruber]